MAPTVPVALADAVADGDLSRWKKRMALSATIRRTSSAGDAREVLGDDPVGVRELGFLVREIGRPDQLVDADHIAQADADAVLLEAPQDVLLADSRSASWGSGCQPRTSSAQ